jgi:hypothetical protein
LGVKNVVDISKNHSTLLIIGGYVRNERDARDNI